MNVDGDKVTSTWWQHIDADTYPVPSRRWWASLSGGKVSYARGTVPADAAAGQTLHLISEVKDARGFRAINGW